MATNANRSEIVNFITATVSHWYYVMALYRFALPAFVATMYSTYYAAPFISLVYYAAQVLPLYCANPLSSVGERSSFPQVAFLSLVGFGYFLLCFEGMPEATADSFEWGWSALYAFGWGWLAFMGVYQLLSCLFANLLSFEWRWPIWPWPMIDKIFGLMSIYEFSLSASVVWSRECLAASALAIDSACLPFLLLPGFCFGSGPEFFKLLPAVLSLCIARLHQLYLMVFNKSLSLSGLLTAPAFAKSHNAMIAYAWRPVY